MSSLSFAPVPSTSTSALSPSNRYSSTEIVDDEANLSDTMTDHIMQAESLYNDDDDDDDDDEEGVTSSRRRKREACGGTCNAV